MANKRISELPAAAALTGSELLLLTQGAASVQATAQDIADLGGGGAAATAQYVTLATDATLPNERVLAVGTGLLKTDAGAGLTVTIAPDFGTVAGKVAQGNDSRFTNDRMGLGLRTTLGSVGLTMGALADGAVLMRSGNSLIGMSAGSGTGTFCAGDDARLSDTRIAYAFKDGNGDAYPLGILGEGKVLWVNAGEVTAIEIGTAAGMLCAGDDARLSNARLANGFQETSGPTSLTLGPVTDGQLLARDGTTVSGVSIGTTAGTVAAGDDARLTSDRIANQLRETGGPTLLTMGSVPVNRVLFRTGTTIVGMAIGTAVSTLCAGDDARLSDERVAYALLDENKDLLVNGVIGDEQVLTRKGLFITGTPIGTGAGQICASDDTRLTNDRTASGLRTTTGPTLLTMGAVTDGQVLKRTGTTVVGMSTGTAAGTLCTGNDARLSDDRVASAFRTLTGIVTISGSALPAGGGQIPTTTDSNTAAWQYPTAPTGSAAAGHIGGSGLTRIYIAGHTGGSALTTNTAPGEVLVAIPMRMPNRNSTIDQISAYVAVGAAGETFRLGIYSNMSDEEMYPNELIDDSGDLAADTAGKVSYTSSAKFAPNQLVWVVHLVTVPVDFKAVPTASVDSSILGFDDTFGSEPGAGISVAFTYDVLPANFPAGGAVIFGDRPPAVALRFVS